MVDDCLLGIDIGTTTVKAGVIGPDGSTVSHFSEDYPTRRREGLVEQDAEDWVRLVEAACAELSGHSVVALGLCSQVNTHVFVDADGRALMPAIQWQDARAGKEAEELDARVPEERRIEWWGAPMPIDASHAIARMAWVARHHPDIWNRTRYVMLPKDYCLWRLTGVPSTDPVSNIGLVGPDLKYVGGVFDLVPGSSDKMAPLLPVTEIIGPVNNGPVAGVPAASGTMDAWAGLVGAGTVREGRAAYLSGTSEILGISSRTITPTPGAIVFPECGGIRLHAGPTNNGGDALAWFATVAGLNLGEINALVAGQQRSALTPLFLPQLEGERAPLWNPNLRAAFMGVSRGTGTADLARAVFEGVAFSARHILETLVASSGVAPEWIIGGGGGFRSRTWNQIRADALGIPVRVLSSDQPGVLGAALIAGLACGQHASIEAASDRLMKIGDVYQPDSGRTREYDEVFAIYKDAVEKQADVVDRLRQAAGD